MATAVTLSPGIRARYEPVIGLEVQILTETKGLLRLRKQVRRSPKRSATRRLATTPFHWLVLADWFLADRFSGF
jgi:hypothetical protein